MSKVENKHVNLMDSIALLLVGGASTDIAATALIRDDGGYKLFWSKNAPVSGAKIAYVGKLASTFEAHEDHEELPEALVEVVAPHVAGKMAARRNIRFEV